jgi:hypothetical protein
MVAIHGAKSRLGYGAVSGGRNRTRPGGVGGQGYMENLGL